MSHHPPPPFSVKSLPDSPKGRSLHADRDFPLGSLLARLTPTIIVPSRAQAREVCNYCFAAPSPATNEIDAAASGPAPVRLCVGCRATAYCGKKCQRAHWKLIHDRECKVLRALQPAVPGGLPALSRALLQALLLPDDLHGHLEGNVAKVRAVPGRWADVSLQASGITRCVSISDGKGATPPPGSVERAAEMLCRLQTNTFDRTDEDTNATGLFLEPTLAMANHSCVPNVAVQCVGRSVVLHAERDIKAGEEIEISYIDYTFPPKQRKQALASYFFACSCLRCREDLTVYELCRQSPITSLNETSLVRPSKLGSPPSPAPSAREAAELAFEECQTLAGSLPSSQNLRMRYSRCSRLVGDRLWALQPLSQLVTDATIAYSRAGDFPCALATACLSTLHCTPFQHVSPYNASRLKGIFAIAKLLSNTAMDVPSQSPGTRQLAAGGGSGVRDEIIALLRDTDQVSLCQILLLIVLGRAETRHPTDWSVLVEARDMLREISGLPGRQGESSLVREWVGNPRDAKSRAFFEYAAVNVVESLAGLGEDLLADDFGKK